MKAVPDFGAEKKGAELGGPLDYGEPMARQGGGLICKPARPRPTLQAVKVGRCRLPISQLVLKAPMVSALEAIL
jgi:hypothetical protein